MKKITLKLPEYNSLRDIKYSDLLKFQEIVKLNDGESEVFLAYKLLNIFYGIDKETARNLSPEQFDLLCSKIFTVLNENVSLQNIIIMDGIEYGLIPNFSKITTGELIDLDDLLSNQKFIEIFSVLYRPIIGEINKRGEYRIEEYKGYDNKFKDIDAFTALGCLGFFMKSFQILNQIILSSSVQKK